MVLGITGGVASGKSTLTGMLMELGGPLGAIAVSADAIARELLAPGTVHTCKVIDHFGESIRVPGSENTIDRSKLAALVFSNGEERKWLESLLHPVIDSQVQAAIAPFRGTAVVPDDLSHYRLALAEIPLLYEVHVESTVDAVAVASCSVQTQVARLCARRPELTEADALRQIHAQLPIAEKAARADYVIDTELSLAAMRMQAHELFDQLVRWRV